MASAWDGATARVAGHRLRRRTGAVVNYAEDVHLREDVPCGCALCGTCANDDVQDGGHPVGTPLGADATHYLVPDADAIAEHVDFLEMPRSATNVIVLGSEVRRAHARGDARLSRRIRDVHNDRRRSVRMFPNEHCAHTSVVAAARNSGARARSGGGADDANTANIPNPTFSVFHDPVLRAAAWYAGKVRGASSVVYVVASRSALAGNVRVGHESDTDADVEPRHERNEPVVLNLVDHRALDARATREGLEEVEPGASRLRSLGRSIALVEVVGDFRQTRGGRKALRRPGCRLFVPVPVPAARHRVHELPVHHHVRVPTNRRRKVRVQRQRQSVMRIITPFDSTGSDAIPRLGHRPRRHPAEQRVRRRRHGSRRTTTVFRPFSDTD